MSTTDPWRAGDGTGSGDASAAGGGTWEHDAGRHAARRPSPAPPGPDGPPPDPVVSPTASRPGTGAPQSAAGSAGPTPAPRSGAAAGTGGTDRDGVLFPDPHAPPTPHAGSHVLGALVGLVLAPLAIGLLLLGQSHILRVQTDGWDASLELLGIVLVSSGVLVLVALLALGLWSAAVPVTAGLVTGGLGGVQLYAPGIARAATLDLLGEGTWDRTVAQATVAGTSGTTFAVGVSLLTAGVVIALARRHGVRLGAFRERNRVS